MKVQQDEMSQIHFAARCIIVQSAILRLYVVRPSICLSICNVGGSGSHRLEILETNCTTISPTPSLFVAQDHPPTPRRTWGNFEESSGGVRKVVC